MKIRALTTAVFASALSCGFATSQPAPAAAVPDSATVALPDSAALLEWTPPALAALSSQAGAKENFTLDRAMLAAAAGLLPDSDADVRHAAAKLDGVSVHLLRFGQPGMIDESQVEALRAGYHARGWKHIVTKTSGAEHNDTTDVWMAMDGPNLRCAVVMVESPRSLTLATIAGDLSPLDLLHLRGHFWIPKFATDALGGTKGR